MTVQVNESMLTTKDNPFNPFTQWEEWYAYDVRKGYNTSAYLARVVRSSDDLSEVDQSLAIDDAMDEIIAEDPFGLYVKVESNNKTVQ